MNRLAFFFLCLDSLLLPTTRLPANPLVTFPVGDMACSVAVSPSTPPTPSAPAASGPATSELATAKPANVKGSGMTSIAITRIGHLRRDIMTWADGSTTQTWMLLDKGLALFEKRFGPSSAIYELQEGSIMRGDLLPPLLEFDDASVPWLTPSTLTGQVFFQKQKALHYQATVSRPAPQGPPTQALFQAWIDPKTLTPIAFDDGTSLFVLTFSSDAPKGPLELPDRFKKELQQYENATASLKHL